MSGGTAPSQRGQTDLPKTDSVHLNGSQCPHPRAILPARPSPLWMFCSPEELEGGRPAPGTGQPRLLAAVHLNTRLGLHSGSPAADTPGGRGATGVAAALRVPRIVGGGTSMSPRGSSWAFLTHSSPKPWAPLPGLQESLFSLQTPRWSTCRWSHSRCWKTTSSPSTALRRPTQPSPSTGRSPC